MASETNIGMISYGTATVYGDVNGKQQNQVVRDEQRRRDAVDVVVVTALREEFEAARAAVPAHWQARDTATAPYLAGRYGGLTLALARTTAMGARSTGPVAAALVLALKPRCLAMSGVCAGHPDRTAPGDVVVADPAYEYDEGKLSGARFRGDHRQYPQDTRWLRAAQEFDPSALPAHDAATEQDAAGWLLERLHRGQDARTHPARSRYFPRGTWNTRLSGMEREGLIAWRDGSWTLTGAGSARIERLLADDVDGPVTLPFAVQAGPMASGSAVIEDPQIWDELQDQGGRKILALDMEAATIATVAHDNRVPHWLVAKGVMDGARPGKDDRFKEFAARASAEVLYALLSRVLSGAPDPARP
uniref:5'-methylthioadenosine/S-adenosylhomocysteine nucleosidase family protein n=1 Tax=Paractinoplanes polyasparticus TaxID=2856853 RepID=UPI001C857238|nr:hypothetical protein [Actinoplanes polyasparticus]